MKKTILLSNLILLCFCTISAFADKSPNLQPSNSYTTNPLETLLSASGSSTLVYYPYTTNLDYTILSASISSATTDFSNLDNYYIGDDGFGNILETYPANGATSYATAVSNNSYFTLTLSGIQASSLDSLVFSVAKGGSADPRGYFVRSSVDGYASDLISETLPSGFSAAPVRKSIALGLAFDGISSVTFRFYIFTPTPADNSVDFRDLTVKGNTNPPVPVSMWSIVAGLMLIVLFTLYRTLKKRRIALKA